MKKLVAVAAIAALAMIGIAACVPFGPTIVAKNSYIMQTSSTGTVTLYTPSEDGDYVISAYGVDGPDGTIETTLKFYWTDDYFSSNQDVMDLSGYSYGSIAKSIHVTSGNPIQFSLAYYCSTCSSSYDLVVTLTKQ